ncbi:MAG: FUSC family protein [Lachnospiraceae bacterium]|nr:FUSC family protein [Lachnospiraceae bacterium]
MCKKKKSIPKIGLRIIKSAIGVMLCFLIYLLRGGKGTPFYSALAVLWCIQSHHKDSVKNALQRTVGTAIGASYGLLFILLKGYVWDVGYGLLHYLILSAFIVPIIYTTILLNRNNASYFSCVVYLSIVVNHLTDANPFFFVLDRSLDTMIGILLGLIINLVHLHGKVQKEVLFIADMDHAMRSTGEKLTPFSRFTLTNLLDDGMNLTVMTLRTPATYLETMGEVRPRIPIIAMDGALLYDVNENSYPKMYVISAVHATEIETFLRGKGFVFFTTVILEDVLLIYYDELHNEAERRIFEKLHRSPYRNYLKKQRPVEHAAVYYMLIDTEERISALLDDMEKAGYRDQFKILSYPSDDYPGYRYIKIYNKNATTGNMIDYLKEEYGFQTVVSVGDHQSRHTVDRRKNDSNDIVHYLNRRYYWG